MARKPEEIEGPGTCDKCLWLDTKWRGNTCRSKGIDETSEACPRFEEPLQPSWYRSIPVMLRARKTLKDRSMQAPVGLRDELKTYLVASQKTYKRALNDKEKAVALLAKLQAYRDRTTEIIDDLNVRLTRVKHLKDSVRFEVLSLKDVESRSTVKARDQFADEVMRPILKRYDFLKDLQSFSSSVLFGVRDALSSLYVVFGNRRSGGK